VRERREKREREKRENDANENKLNIQFTNQCEIFFFVSIHQCLTFSVFLCFKVKIEGRMDKERRGRKEMRERRDGWNTFNFKKRFPLLCNP
jgi:hypothetical protein